MERTVIKLEFKKHNSSSNEIVNTVYCESFYITFTGYVAVNHFDGGYNCVHKVEDIVCVSMVQKSSIFKNEEEYEDHKEAYPEIYDPTQDNRFFY